MKKILTFGLVIVVFGVCGQNSKLNSFANSGASIFFPSPGASVPAHIGVIGQAMASRQGGTLVISNLMFAKDLQPPTITYDPTTLIVRLGEESPMTFSASDNDQVASTTIFYKPIGSLGSFLSAAPSLEANNSYLKAVTPSWFDVMGMEYYIEVKDKENTTRHPPGAGKHVAFSIHPGPQIPTNLLSYGKTKNNYRIISIPFLTNSPIAQIFEELGPSDKKKYRIYKYEDNAFKEYPSFTTVSQGQGYFIIMSDALSNVVLSMPEFQAPPNHQSALYEVALKPGWNLIGNPYTVEINWDDVKKFNNDPTSVGSDLKIWTEAGNYSNIKNLAAYQGAFVFVNGTQPIALKIPFKGQLPENTSGRTHDQRKSASWQVNLTVSISDETNSTAAFGMHERALETFDGWDDLSPPTLQEYLQVKFLHPEHPEKFFTRDIRPFAEKQAWEFEVPASNSDTRLLSWSRNETAMLPHDLFLYDIDQNRVVNMKTNSQYSFPRSSATFRILFGRHSGDEIYPDQVTVLAPFPNPIAANQQAVFSIGIPDSQAMCPVELRLFNTVGRMIFENTSTLPTGLHTIELPAHSALEVMPGELLYYKIIVGKSVHSGKIIYAIEK